MEVGLAGVGWRDREKRHTAVIEKQKFLKNILIPFFVSYICYIRSYVDFIFASLLPYLIAV